MADPTTQTLTQSNIPEYARPYIESMLGATQQQLFDISPEGQVLGLKGYTPYSVNPEDYVAGFSPMQQQAMQGIAGLQVPGQFGQAASAVQDAMQRAQQASQYSPTSFTNRYAAPSAYQAGQFSTTDVNAPQLQQFQMKGPQQVGTGSFIDPGAAQAYMSPYVQQALNPQLAEIQRQSDIAQQGVNRQAVAAGAFGGTRQALQSSEQARNAQTLMSQATGQGYQSAYDRAMQQYSTDAARQLAAQQANQAANLTTNQANLQALLGVQALGSGQSMQAQLANQQAKLAAQQAAEQSRQYGYGQQMTAAQLAAQYGLSADQAAEASRQFGAGLGMQGVQAGLTGAGLLGSLGQQQLAAQQGILGAQMNAGALQQQQQQNIINQAIQNYQTGQQYPMQQLAFMNSMIRGLPMQDTTTQTYAAAPSMLSQLAGLGTSIYGLNKMFGDSSSGGSGGGFSFDNLSNLYNQAKNFFGWGGKEGGQVKGYAGGGTVKSYGTGGITDIDRAVMNDPLKYSEKEIQAGIQNKTLSGVAGLLALDQIAKAKQNAQQNQALQQSPAQTILQKLASAAGEQPMGIDQANVNPEMFTAAGGGIVAFNGEEDSFVLPEDDSASYMATANTDIVTPDRIKQEEAEIAAGTRLEYSPEVKAALITANKKASADYLARERQSQLNRSREIAAEAKYPWVGEPPAAAAATRPQLDIGFGPGKFTPDYTSADTKGGPTPEFVTPSVGAAPALKAAATPSAVKKPATPATPTTDLYDEEQLKRFEKLQERFGVKKDAYADLKEKIANFEKGMSKSKEDAVNEAILMAGLGMMGGTSRHALTNIAEGGKRGLEAYGASQKDIKEREREILKMHSELAKAEDARARGDFESYQKHMETAQDKEFKLKKLDLDRQVAEAQVRHYAKPGQFEEMMAVYRKDPKAFSEMMAARTPGFENVEVQKIKIALADINERLLTGKIKKDSSEWNDLMSKRQQLQNALLSGISGGSAGSAGVPKDISDILKKYQ